MTACACWFEKRRTFSRRVKEMNYLVRLRQGGSLWDRIYDSERKDN